MSNKDITLEFADGTQLTSQQLGYFCFRWSATLAEQILAEFSPGKLAASFPAAEAINASPFVAQLYLSALHVGTYLSYVASILRAPEHSIEFFMTGVSDSLGDLRAPNGQSLNNSEKRAVLQSVAEFAHAIDQDMASAVGADPAVFNPSTGKASALAIQKLLGAYSESSAAPTSLSIIGLGHLLADAPVHLMSSLQKQLGLKLARNVRS